MHDKVKKILEYQSQGLDKKDIAKKLGYQRMDSLNRFMRKKGYKIMNSKFVMNNISSDENKTVIIPKENMNSEKTVFSFSDLNSKITNDINKEYNRLIKNFPQNKLRILAMMLLKEHFDYVDKNNYESNKILPLIKSVRTFFEVAFKNDFSKLQKFLNKNNIPYDKQNITNYNSIRLFVKNDKLLNKYLQNLKFEQLENLRKELSYINPFTENFQRALRINKNDE